MGTCGEFSLKNHNMAHLSKHKHSVSLCCMQLCGFRFVVRVKKLNQPSGCSGSSSSISFDNR